MDQTTIHLTVALAPRELGKHKETIESKLDDLRCHEVPEAGGILLEWKNLKIYNKKGLILDDQPFVFYNVSFSGVVFHVEIGKIMKGRIEKIVDTFMIAKALESFSITVTIAENLIDNQLTKSLAIEEDVFFRVTSISEGVYRGIFDDECFEQTEKNRVKQDVTSSVFNYAQNFEY